MPGLCKAWRLGVIAAPGSVPHRGQLWPQHLQPLRPMCWGGARPFKVSLVRCPRANPSPMWRLRHPSPPTSLADLRRIPSWSRIWATSSLVCQSSERGIRCAEPGLPPSGVGWGEAGKRRPSRSCLCPPRHCCVLGLECTWTPPVPTPQLPPPTSTTLSCGRRSTSPSSCPTGTCASEVLAWGLVGCWGSWASERFLGILCLGFLSGGTVGTQGMS